MPGAGRALARGSFRRLGSGLERRKSLLNQTGPHSGPLGTSGSCPDPSTKHRGDQLPPPCSPALLDALGPEASDFTLIQWRCPKAPPEAVCP